MIAISFIQLQTVLFFLSSIQKVQTNPNQCQDLILKQNEKHCELREMNAYFVGQNSENLTNINTLQNHEDLIELSSGPILYSKDDIIISMKFRELIKENQICSLIYNPQLTTYSINCISTEQTYIIDSKMMISIKTQFNIVIQTESNFNCSQFDYNTQGFAVFCYSFHQVNLYQLQEEQEQFKQTIIYQSEILNLSCRIKFYAYSNIFYILYFQCQGWMIHIYENNQLKLEINQNLLREKYNIEGILLDILICQTNFIILLSSGGYQYYKEKFIVLFEAENLQLDEILYEYNSHCILKFAIKNLSQDYIRFTFFGKYRELILNTKELPRNIFSISNPASLFLKYDDYVIFYINQPVQQTIKINIQNLIQLSNQRIYIGIGEGNQIKQFLIKYSKPCLPYKNENQKSSKYYIQFIDISFPILREGNIFQCFKPIIIENDELKEEYAILINTKNKNQYIERKNYEESFQIKFLASSIQSIQPYKISFRSSLPQIKFQLKNNEIKCKFNHQLKNYNGKFIIKTQKDLIHSVIVQSSNNDIIEYHCQSSQIYIYQNILPLNEQILHKFFNQNILILLDQQKQCLYKIGLDEVNQDEMVSKMMCLSTQVEKIFSINNQIILKLKDQAVFYNLFQSLDQLKLEQNYILSQIKNQNIQDIFQISLDFYGILYKNELHLISKQVTVQIINITANILGFLNNSQSNLITSLVLLDINKNELQFYVVSITEFIQIRNYNLENYVPIQPLQFRVLESKIIISCQHKINKKYYLLIFNCAFKSTLHLLQKVIETTNQYFWIQKYDLYYYDAQNELVVQDLLYINLEIQYQDFNNKISQEIIIQMEVELENIEIPPQKQDILIILINPTILNLTKTNVNLFIRNNDQVVNFRNFIIGQIDNIILNKNDNFKLRNPLDKEMVQQCQYYCNRFCFQVNNSEFIIFFKFEFFQKTYLVYNYQKYIFQLLFVELIKEDLFLFINQINNSTILISLVFLKDNFFTIKKQLDTQIYKELKNIILVQNILLIQTKQSECRFLITDHDIDQVDITSLNQQGQIYHITQDIYIEVMVNSFEKNIVINLFEISNSILRIYRTFEISIINSKMKNFFIEEGSPILSNQIKLVKQDFNQNLQQLNLTLFIMSMQAYDAQFQICLYLNEQKYEFINQKLLRYPKSVSSCQYILIEDDEIILECGLTRYFYDMYNSDFLCDPIYSSKILDQMEILNSTHYIFNNYYLSNQSVVLYVGKRGGYSLQKLSQDNTEPIYLEFQAISIDQKGINQVTLNLQVIVEQNEFSYLNVLIVIIIFLIILTTIIIFCRQHKKQEFKNVIKTEIRQVELI